MRRLQLPALSLLLALLLPFAAFGQTNTTVNWINSNNKPVQASAANPLPVTASVSASISGFPGASPTTGTPISVTTGGVTGTLPAGAVVVASNVGTTNIAYCKLGASATTADQPIAPNGGWFAFTVGAATQLTCITSTSTTVVNMVGGAGLPTGTGGGGGGSGGGGAITAASGSYASGALSSGSIASGALASGAGTDGWDSTQGAKADSVCGTATGTCSVVALLKFLNTAASLGTAANGAAPSASSVQIGGIASGATGGLVQGLKTCDLHTYYDGTTNGLSDFATVVGNVASRKVYICGYAVMTGGTATNVSLWSGTGANCGSTSTQMTQATQLGVNDKFGANAGVWNGLASLNTGDRVCVKTSAGNAVQAEIWYTIQ